MGFGFYGTYAALWGIVLFQGLLVIALLKQIVDLRRAVETGGGLGLDLLPPGTEAPPFSAPDVRAGHRLTAGELRGGLAVLLFVTPGCTMCKTVLDGLRGRDLLRKAQIVIVSTASSADAARAALADRIAPGLPLLADPDETLRHAYRVSATPAAVILDAGGRIRGYTYPKDAGELEAKLATA